MAQWVKSLPCKSEDMCFDSQHSQENPGLLLTSQYFEADSRRSLGLTGFPLYLPVSSMIRKRHAFSITKVEHDRGRHPTSTSGLTTKACTWAYTHEHVHTQFLKCNFL